MVGQSLTSNSALTIAPRHLVLSRRRAKCSARYRVEIFEYNVIDYSAFFRHGKISSGSFQTLLLSSSTERLGIGTPFPQMAQQAVASSTGFGHAETRKFHEEVVHMFDDYPEVRIKIWIMTDNCGV
jgi:hypothetical protein